MAQRLVHFASNRLWDEAGAAFGASCAAPPERLWLGAVAVGLQPDPDGEAGAVGAPVVDGIDDFADAQGTAATVLAEWLDHAEAAGAVPLLTVHGFNYNFAESCARAGNFCDVVEAVAGLRLAPLAFCWPSNGVGSLDEYRRDQQDCDSSGPALARLIRQIGLAAAGRARKPVYLAHSMGARATRCAMQALVAQGGLPAAAVFAQAIVVAGDEAATVLEPGTGALWPLAAVADWVTIGVFAGDSTLSRISGLLNGMERLGAGGPVTAPPPASRVFVVDYGLAVTWREVPPGGTSWNYQGHQYYRNDRPIIRDLALALGGTASPEGIAGRRWARVEQGYAIREIAGRLYLA
ncbi:alpha/beta hydrolase [Roseomonas sp. 18066]|uniref:alpha/beta hydrolase n=1 Tax=Roseomonas sp. 18066 TaxID=2681412 RepID=UPI0013573A5B|nr:alpha/beta hydrolase [Roseomonas sp. 18066]